MTAVEKMSVKKISKGYVKKTFSFESQGIVDV